MMYDGNTMTGDWSKNETPILEVSDLVKVFPGTKALDGMNFNLYQGEVRAIVGENGAGKSTLMKILSGAYTKTSGKIAFDGKEVQLGSIEASQELGISMIYQELENLAKLSVAENIFIGRLPESRFPGLVNFKRLYSDSRKLLDDYKVNINPKAKLSTLPIAEQQFVEIIKAVTAQNTRIVIMDEPTSSLTKEEAERLFDIISVLKKNRVSIIYISHRLDEITDIADSVSVFRDGRNCGTLQKGEFERNKIIALMVGHEIEEEKKNTVERNRVIFEVRNLHIRNRIQNFSVKLYQGEILGIAGLMGSGKDELAKSLFGLWPSDSKKIHFEGREIRIKNPMDAIKNGIVYLPEERKLQSLFLELSVKENISPIWMNRIQRKLFLRQSAESALARKSIDDLAIKTPSPNVQIFTLSGGNQQKAIFSRLLAVEPKIMILNDPTRGVDVKSKEAIHSYIRNLAQRGTSILFLSSEIPEITYLANRVVVLSKGEVVGEYTDDDVTTRNILTSATRV